MRTAPINRVIGAIRTVVLPTILFAMLFGATPYALATPADTIEFIAGKREFMSPRLSVDIPYVSFHAVSFNEGAYDIPWLANYITGVYSYAVSIAALLAGVMFVIGGFYYLTAGGDASRVQKGKERIADAIIGLFLVVGSYMLLITINPNLVTLTSLSIKKVEADPFEMVMDSLMTTDVATGTDPSIDSTGTTGTPPVFTPPPGAADLPNTPLPPPSGNQYQLIYNTCPFRELLPKETIERPPTGPRGTMFRDRMRREILPGIPNLRQKIAATAQAGANCGAHYNSCGAHATTWWAIAGVGPDILGTNRPNAGGTSRWNGVSHETPNAFAHAVLGVACNTVCGGSRFRDACGARCDALPPDRRGDIKYRVSRDCVSGTAAKAAVRAMFEGTGGPAGWPDSWTVGLEIGDFVITYNGNPSCGASHAQIFLGWVGGGRAKMANGQDSGPHPRWISTDCLMRACGDFKVVTKIFKPSSLAH